MFSFRSAALAALILALGVAEGFVPTDGMKSSRISLAMCPGGETNDSENDPTGLLLGSFAEHSEHVARSLSLRKWQVLGLEFSRTGIQV